MKEVIFLSDVLIAAIALIWVFVATIQDIKKKEVANWLSFSLIIISLSLRAIASIISLEAGYFFWGVAVAIILFGIANLFYYSRIFAGGDAKLLIALGAAFATTPVFTPIIKTSLSGIPILPFNAPFILVFIMNMLFVGSAYGLFFAAYLAFRNIGSFKKEFAKILKRGSKWAILCVSLGILFLIANNFFFSNNSPLVITCILIAIFPFLFAFVKSVENTSMIKLVKPSELTEGDWLVNDIRIGRKVINPRFSGLDNNEILLLRKRNKKVIIKQGIPFVPVFLMALLISFFIDILELLLISFL
jgi:hypothetical protein